VKLSSRGPCHSLRDEMRLDTGGGRPNCARYHCLQNQSKAIWHGKSMEQGFEGGVMARQLGKPRVEWLR
jgi:hypothetical protein